ncbi:unnamed protein product [Ectocarpus sp. 12 AP-2014]
MHLLLLLMALLVQVGQAWILPASSPLRAAPRSNVPAVTVAGSLGEGDAGMDSSVVRALLSKPIGLILAEKEIGKPGLRVDDMVEGGSAEESGVVLRGMTLVAACGVDGGESMFDQVVEMLQNTPPEAPIDFVCSTEEAELEAT